MTLPAPTPHAPNADGVIMSLRSLSEASCKAQNSTISTTTTWQVPSSAKLADSSGYWWRVREIVSGQLSGWSPGSKFTVHVNYFGARDYWPTWTHGPATVNLATGNLVLAAPTPSFPTANGSLSVSLAYNSQDTRSGFDSGLGIGWTIAGGDTTAAPPARLVDHAVLTGSSQMDAAEIVWPDGNSDYYSHLGSGPVYQAPPGDISQLVVSGSGSSQLWTLTDPTSGAIYTFGPENTTTGVAQLQQAELQSSKKSVSAITLTYSSGYLISIADSSDPTRLLHLYWHAIDSGHCSASILCIVGPDNVSWHYTGTAGTSGSLATVNDGTRNLLTIGYTSGCPTSLKNANDLAGLGARGHQIAIGYTASPVCGSTGGNKPKVISIADGPTTGQTPSTSTWSFGYASGGSTDPTHADHANLAAGSSRPAAGSTSVTVPNQQGQPSPALDTVWYDSLNHPIEHKDRLGRVTQSGYNGLDQQLWSEDADGNPTDNSWDPDLNVLTATTGPDPDGAGSAPRPVSGYRYDETQIGTASTPGAPLHGLQAFYYNGVNFSDPDNHSGRARVIQTDPNVDVTWQDGPAVIGNATTSPSSGAASSLSARRATTPFRLLPTPARASR